MRNHSFVYPEDDSDELLHKYEESTSNNHIEYFDVEELEVIIDFYLQKGRSKESSKAIDLGLKLHPSSTPIQARRAKLYSSLEKFDEALKIIEQINKIETDDLDNLLLHGEILVKLKRFKDADIIFKKAITVETENKDQI
jgi:tetratricopeptide (TPR) repeat protein